MLKAPIGFASGLYPSDDLPEIGQVAEIHGR